MPLLPKTTLTFLPYRNQDYGISNEGQYMVSDTLSPALSDCEFKYGEAGGLSFVLPYLDEMLHQTGP